MFVRNVSCVFITISQETRKQVYYVALFDKIKCLMKLLRSIQHFSLFDQGTVATVGNFDGVHLGHQSLINRLKDKANQLKLPLVVILFEPQPREYFQRNQAPARLSSLREKLDVLRLCQINTVYCFKFDHVLAETSAADFSCSYLFSMLNVKYLLVGEDFRFGKNREGDVSLLRKLSTKYVCEIDIHSNFCIDEERISSTKIRLALQQGDMNTAAKYLGRWYSICGRVVRGDGRGRQWGIPTINLTLHRLSLPVQGVFVVQVAVAGSMVCGVANVGCRPTVDGNKNVLEVHLFDFDRSLYGEFVQVFFLHKLRNEVKFTSVDALIAQINDDIAMAKAFIKKFNNDFAE